MKTVTFLVVVGLLHVGTVVAQEALCDPCVDPPPHRGPAWQDDLTRLPPPGPPVGAAGVIGPQEVMLQMIVGRLYERCDAGRFGSLVENWADAGWRVTGCGGDEYVHLWIDADAGNPSSAAFLVVRTESGYTPLPAAEPLRLTTADDDVHRELDALTADEWDALAARVLAVADE